MHWNYRSNKKIHTYTHTRMRTSVGTHMHRCAHIRFHIFLMNRYINSYLWTCIHTYALRVHTPMRARGQTHLHISLHLNTHVNACRHKGRNEAAEEFSSFGKSYIAHKNDAFFEIDWLLRFCPPLQICIRWTLYGRIWTYVYIFAFARSLNDRWIYNLNHNDSICPLSEWSIKI